MVCSELISMSSMVLYYSASCHHVHDPQCDFFRLVLLYHPDKLGYDSPWVDLQNLIYTRFEGHLQAYVHHRFARPSGLLPEFGTEDPVPVLPDVIPKNNVGKAMLAEYNNDHKEWKSDLKKYTEHKKVVFSLVYTQLSESSRSEVQDNLQLLELSNARDLLYLIRRIRATHIARQSGNPGMDSERVRMSLANVRMQTNENSFEFRKRVENHQLQKASVGLPIIPESELVIGILNKLDMSRYAQLSKDYFDNERQEYCGAPSSQWHSVERDKGFASDQIQG